MVGILNKPRESVQITLNLIKDSGWCYTFGIISVVAFVPVLTFQCYETWKARKRGAHEFVQNLSGLFAVMANGSWMLDDLYFNNKFHIYSRWLFFVGLVLLVLYGILAFLFSKKEEPEKTRVMSISQETKSVVFVHGRFRRRRPHHVMMVRHRHHQSNDE